MGPFEQYLQFQQQQMDNPEADAAQRQAALYGVPQADPWSFGPTRADMPPEEIAAPQRLPEEIPPPARVGMVDLAAPSNVQPEVLPMPQRAPAVPIPGTTGFAPDEVANPPGGWTQERILPNGMRVSSNAALDARQIAAAKEMRDRQALAEISQRYAGLDLTQSELLQLRNMENARSQVMNDVQSGRVSATDANAYLRMLDSHFNPLEQRRQAAQIRHTQEQDRLLQAQQERLQGQQTHTEYIRMQTSIHDQVHKEHLEYKDELGAWRKERDDWHKEDANKDKPLSAFPTPRPTGSHWMSDAGARAAEIAYRQSLAGRAMSTGRNQIDTASTDGILQRRAAQTGANLARVSNVSGYVSPATRQEIDRAEGAHSVAMEYLNALGIQAPPAAMVAIERHAQQTRQQQQEGQPAAPSTPAAAAHAVHLDIQEGQRLAANLPYSARTRAQYLIGMANELTRNGRLAPSAMGEGTLAAYRDVVMELRPLLATAPVPVSERPGFELSQ